MTRAEQGQPEPSPEWSRQDWAFLVSLAGLAVLFHIPDVLSGQVPLFRDLSYYHYPNLFFVQRSVAQESFPLWNPLHHLGRASYADPHAGVFYPPTYLFAGWPPSAAMGAYLAFHQCVAAIGTFVLVRHLGLTRTVAFFAAMSFAFSGVFLSCTELLNILRVLTWLPVALALWLSYLESSSRVVFSLLCGVLALALVGGSPMVFILVIVLLVLLTLARAFSPTDRLETEASLKASSKDRRKEKESRLSSSRARTPSVTRGALATRHLALLLAALSISGCLAAVQLLPLAELTSHSVRTAGSQIDLILRFSLRPRRFLEMFVPPHTSGLTSPWLLINSPGHEMTLVRSLYMGSLFPILLVLTPSSRRLIGLRRPLLACTGLAVLLALGKDLPLFEWVHAFIPGMKLFRFPEKLVFLIHICLVLVAAIGLSSLDSNSSRRKAATGAMALSFAGLALCGLALLVPEWIVRILLGHGQGLKIGEESIAHAAGLWREGALWFVGVNAAFAGLVVFSMRRHWSGPALFLAVACLAGADLFISGQGTVPRTDASILTSPPLLKPSLPDGVAPLRVISVVDDFGMVYLGSHYTYHHHYTLLKEALQGQWAAIQGYAPLLHGSPILLEKEAQLLNLMNKDEESVIRIAARLGGERFIATHDCPPGTEELLVRAGNIRVCRILGSTPRAFIPKRAVMREPGYGLDLEAAFLSKVPFTEEVVAQPSEGTGPRELSPIEGRGSVEIVSYSNNKVLLKARPGSEGLVVLLDLVYPGWDVQVDGQERDVLRVNGLFRGVRLNPGEREIRFVFRPGVLFLGLALSITTLLLLLVWTVRGTKGPRSG